MPSSVSFTLPGSEYQAEADAIARRQRMAQALQEQAFQPMQMPQQPGVLVSPFQGLAQMLRAYTGAVGERRAEQDKLDLASRAQERASADMSRLAEALRGRPASPGGLTEDASGNVTQADPMAAMKPSESLYRVVPLLSPEMQQTALGLAQGAQTREDKQAFQSSQEAENRASRLQERMLTLDAASATAGANREMQQNLAQEKNDLMRELAALKGQGGGTPYFTPVPTPGGVVAFNNRTGTIAQPTLGGAAVVKSADSPDLQRNLADAKASGKVAGTARTQAGIDLPTATAAAQNSLQLIDQMVGSEDGTVKPHPGFTSAVGLRIPGLGLIPGTQTASFNALLDQVKGGAFLQAFNTLKGGGQITEREGEKATDAITRMNNSQSEAEFIKAAREFQSILRAGIERSKQKAGQAAPMAGPAGSPGGVDPALWNVMTPEERALWQQ